MAKAPAKKKAAATKREETAALKAEAIDRAIVTDPQSGGVGMMTEDEPSSAQVKAAKKAELEAQFAEADAKAAAELEEVRVGLQVRGY